MKNPTSMRLKPLAACLAAALAIAPAGVLLADPAHRPQSSAHAGKRTHVAQFLAVNSGLTKKGLSLRQVMDEAADKVRAARRPYTPHRPAGTIAVTSCDDSGPGTLREAFTTAVTGDLIDLTTLGCSTISLTTGALVTSVDDLTVQGPGAAALAIDAGGASRRRGALRRGNAHRRRRHRQQRAHRGLRVSRRRLPAFRRAASRSTIRPFPVATRTRRTRTAARSAR